MPNVELTGLACGGCFASVEETNHGGANDSFTLNYNGNVSAPIVNGVNYSAAGILAALTPLLPVGGTATVAGFAGGGFNNTGFQVTYTGTLGLANNPVMLGVQDFTPGASGFTGETDKGGAVDNKGNITATGNTFPTVNAGPGYTIPLRTPFALTGSATDLEGDSILYAWEQNDRGGAAGTSLLNNVKANGPLFAMFPLSAPISEADTLLYNSPNENHVTASPTRVFPDLGQILANNTNADTGACASGPIAPPVPIPVKECFSEFLPTSDYVGFAGVNLGPPPQLHFRLTARDLRLGGGGNSAADTTLTLAPGTGPFLVTSHGASGTVDGGSSQTVTWNVAGTDTAPIGTSEVKISLSDDGGLTYPYVLAEATANDGSETVTLPNVAVTGARIKVEAIGNIFFDVSNANLTVSALPVVTNNAPGGVANVQYSDAISPMLTVTATDEDTPAAALSASASGLPGGLSLADITPAGADSRTWKVAGNVTGAPGMYPVIVTVTDDAGHSADTSFTINVLPEDAAIAYTGDSLAYPAPGATSASIVFRATVMESADGAPGNIRNASVSFVEGSTVLCSSPVALIGSDPATASGSCAASLPIGTHTVQAVAGDFYTGSSSATIDVPVPVKSDIVAKGALLVAQSGGSIPADTGSVMDFALKTVKYKNETGLNFSGGVDVFYRSAGKRYRIDSDVFDSFGAIEQHPTGGSCAGPLGRNCYERGALRAKADLSDVSGRRPALLGSNLTLMISGVDGHSWRPDAIGVTLWNGSTLVFSSRWNGLATVEQSLQTGYFDVDIG